MNSKTILDTGMENTTNSKKLIYSPIGYWNDITVQTRLIFLGYFVGFGIILVIINNLLCITIFLMYKRVYTKITASIRFYYIFSAEMENRAKQLFLWSKSQSAKMRMFHKK